MTRMSLRAIGRLVGGATAATSLVAAVPSAYLGVLTVAGAMRPPRAERRGPGTTRFVVLVPAHDEASGIGETLESLLALDYPSNLVDVHVVADNCTDATADVARRHGVEAHERNDPDDRGKGAALNWLFDRLADRGDGFDAVVIVDADTSVDPQFLQAMDRAMSDGVAAAQGFYSVRDPEASTATSFRYAALACRHHLRALGRCRLGASCGLYGNGMVFRRDVLDSRRWSGHLVEDAEFQNELLLDGLPVHYVPHAVVRAEMPTTTSAAATQNERWERGRLELSRRFVPRHALRAITGPHRIAHGDAVLDHVVPPLSALVGLQVVATGVAAIAALTGRGRRALKVDIAAIGVVVAHTLVGLWAIGASRRHYVALLQAPRLIVWKLGVLVKVAAPGTEVAWTRTQRNDEVDT